MNWIATGASDIGRKRTRNEDAYVIDAGLEMAVVADGMGGHAAGEEASHMTVTIFRDALNTGRAALDTYAHAPSGADTAPVRKLLRDAMSRCTKAVFAEGHRDPGKLGMGTTCSALVVAGTTAFVAHVGDSRVYLVRDRRIVQITTDHTLLGQLVAEGEITQEEADSSAFNKYRSALSRAIGVAANVDTDTLALEVLPGDVFLLCSDGLTRYVGDEELVELARHVPAARLESVLIDVANKRGGIDNITVVCVRLEESFADTTGPNATDPDEIERSARLRERVAVLTEHSLLGDLHHSEILHVLTTAQTDVVAAGDTLHDDPIAEMPLCVILSGRGELEHGDGTSEELRAGEWFGGLSMLGSEDRIGAFVAAESTHVLRFEREDLIEILGKSPHVGRQILASLANS